MSKFSQQGKIKKLKPLSAALPLPGFRLYSTENNPHFEGEVSSAKLSGNAEFLCTAAWAQSDIKDILSRNIPYLNNGSGAQKPGSNASRTFLTGPGRSRERRTVRNVWGYLMWRCLCVGGCVGAFTHNYSWVQNK